MISLILSLAMLMPANTTTNITSNCTEAPVTILKQITVNTNSNLDDPLVYFEAQDFRFTLGREDAFNLLKVRSKDIGEDALQVKALAFLLNAMPSNGLPNNITEIWPDQSTLQGKELQLAINLEHEIVMLFLNALSEGSAAVELTANNKQVAQLNFQEYEATNVRGIRFVTRTQSAFDYCQLAAPE